MTRTVVVLPVPGPPVRMQMPSETAETAACRWLSSRTKPSSAAASSTRRQASSGVSAAGLASAMSVRILSAMSRSSRRRGIG